MEQIRKGATRGLISEDGSLLKKGAQCVPFFMSKSGGYNYDSNERNMDYTDKGKML